MVSSWPRDRTWVSCIAGGFFTVWANREALSLIPYTYFTDEETRLKFQGRLTLSHSEQLESSKDPSLNQLCISSEHNLFLLYQIVTPNQQANTSGWLV